ncbi:chitin synthase chs-2-like [Tachysurus vachellii]|uniref:chitin synthase chs-2-like n=1 Tax=Tachysurus vachellii TaxID=175792 RepID=UPI00296ACB97|nr:chitin synthase chs-2-like [Tachysurus vachellii]
MEEEHRENKYRQAWDACRQLPDIQDEQKQKPKKRFRFMKWYCCCVVAILVFALSLVSKSSFLILVTLGNNVTKSVPEEQKASALLSIGCMLVGPNILLLLKSLWKFIFKSAIKPSKETVMWVIFVEFLVSFGEVVLTVMAMPYFDIITNVMILNSVSILSAVFQVVDQFRARCKRESESFQPMSCKVECGKWLRTIASIIFIILGYILFIINYLVIEENSFQVKTAVCLAIVGTVFVSLNWWENYSSLFPFLEDISEKIASSQNVVCILSSVVKVLVTAAVVVYNVPLNLIPTSVNRTVFGLMAVQIVSSAMCRWFVVVACKIHALRRCFIVPMYLSSVAVMLLFIGLFAPIVHCPNSNSNLSTSEQLYNQTYSIIPLCSLITDIRHTLSTRRIVSEMNVEGLVVLALCAFSWWLGFMLSTGYIWFLKIQRIERTHDLFVKQMYEGAFLEQSLLLNTRFVARENNKDKRSKGPARQIPSEKNGKVRHVNEYAETLVEVVKEVYTIFCEDDPCIFKKKPCLPQQKIISTPYGGRLEYTLPKGNIMMVHLKDKQLIRHKKRWSQIMYLYYLLGWRLNGKYLKMFEKDGHPSVDELREHLKKEKENTYILALDGDTDFQPSAVMLLIDRLKLYPEVGAACGRIHPTGTGPMVWYQKFEYAVGHWLQKTAEHVFGCVLCSPGCFSLFRGAALMDDNVMKRYTTKPTEAIHHVQYDQGEDRWLCTLLVQQGWRVEYNAASDAYTNAPQDFKEFYNQRRRWGPSTMANTIDLLGSGGLTAQRNSSISKPYIVYQVISMGASILGPATICLMIAGSFNFIVNMDQEVALIAATVPPTIYLALCFKLKADTQIQIAAVMSVLYAFLMTGTILSIIGDIVKNETFMTPSGLFLISMTLLYLITAALHPQELSLLIYGVLYFLCIPSGYLLLSIYSIVNMNNVSWGTRETGGKVETVAVSAIKRRVKQAACCKCPCWNTSDDTIEIEPLLSSVVSEEQDLKIHTDSEKRSHECLTLQIPKSWIEDLQGKDETVFWKELQTLYLEPLKENKEQQEKVAEELKDLRNKVTFVFFICNALWLMATLFLQAIGQPVTLPIPKMYPNGTTSWNETFSVDPISLMFLLSFALLLIVQFLAMLYHRIYTLIHFVSYIDTEIKSYYRKKVPATLEPSVQSFPGMEMSITTEADTSNFRIRSQDRNYHN